MGIENDLAVAISQRGSLEKGLENMRKQRDALLAACKQLVKANNSFMNTSETMTKFMGKVQGRIVPLAKAAIKLCE